MSSLSVCKTLSRTMDSSLSLRVFACWHQELRSSFRQWCIRVTMPLVAWRAITLLLSWAWSKRGPINVWRVFPWSRCWQYPRQYLLSLVIDHRRNTMKSAFLFSFTPRDLEQPTSNERHSNEPKSNKSLNGTYFTHGQQYGRSGSDRLFIFGYYGNENALSIHIDCAY